MIKFYDPIHYQKKDLPVLDEFERFVNENNFQSATQIYLLRAICGRIRRGTNFCPVEFDALPLWKIGNALKVFTANDLKKIMTFFRLIEKRQTAISN